MYYANPPQPQSHVQIDQSDLQTLKTLTLLFALSRLAGLGIGFFTNSFGVVFRTIIDGAINYGGLLCLAYGVYLLASKYPKLSSGFKVFYSFILLIAVLLVRTLYNIMFPNVVPSTSDIGVISNQIMSTYWPSFIFTIIIAILTVITTYYCTVWLNLIFGYFNPTKVYYYYGIAFFIGSIITEGGILMVFQNVTPTTNGTTPTINSGALLGALILIIGGITLLAAVILEIVAGFKIYNRFNDMTMGKDAPRMYRAPYANPYQPNAPYGNQQFNNQNPYQNPSQNPYQSPNQNPYQNPNQNPYQSSNQNSDLNPNKVYETNTGVDGGVNPSTSTGKFCKYCGASILSESKFCQSCGAKVE